MDMVKAQVVAEAGEAGVCMARLSDSPLHKRNYRPLGYRYILKDVPIQIGMYISGRDSGSFVAFWAPVNGEHSMAKKPFKGSFNVIYRKTKRIGGMVTIDYKMTPAEGVIDKVTHEQIEFDD